MQNFLNQKSCPTSADWSRDGHATSMGQLKFFPECFELELRTKPFDVF